MVKPYWAEVYPSGDTALIAVEGSGLAAGSVELLSPPPSRDVPATIIATAVVTAAAETARVDLGGNHAVGDVMKCPGQAVLRDHGVTTVISRPAESGVGSASTSASRRAAAWLWLFTVPGAIPRVAAISASERSS